MRRFALLLLVAVLAPAATALAGGWATTAVDELPAGVSAGEPWRVQITVKQHGVTPLAEAKPTVRITSESGAVHEFRARPTGTPGTFVAEVTFPTGGRWNWRIFDGWTDAIPHTFAPVTIGPAAAAADGTELPWHQGVAIAAVALLWMGGWIAGYGWPHPRRRRRRTAAPGRYLPAP